MVSYLGIPTYLAFLQFHLRRFMEGTWPGVRSEVKSDFDKKFQKRIFCLTHWIDVRFKIWKVFPYTTPHGLSENAKKKLGGGILLRPRWDFASPWFQMIQTFYFFYLKFNKMHIILKLSEKLFDLALVGISCIFTLNSWVKRFNGTIWYTVEPTFYERFVTPCCLCLIKRNEIFT